MKRFWLLAPSTARTRSSGRTPARAAGPPAVMSEMTNKPASALPGSAGRSSMPTPTMVLRLRGLVNSSGSLPYLNWNGSASVRLPPARAAGRGVGQRARHVVLIPGE